MLHRVELRIHLGQKIVEVRLFQKAYKTHCMQCFFQKGGEQSGTIQFKGGQRLVTTRARGVDMYMYIQDTTYYIFETNKETQHVNSIFTNCLVMTQTCKKLLLLRSDAVIRLFQLLSTT